jgi:glycosyltransferase involved in cell wall biosynthesis
MAFPLVSILVPVYNREAFLEACVASALNQTYSNIEVVIVDNASTDTTWAICEQFARRDGRVRIFRNATNLGPVPNWQRAIGEARGVLARLLFSDDQLDPACVERTVTHFEDPTIGMVTSAVHISGADALPHVAYRWRSGRASSRACLWAMMFNGRLPVSPCAALMRIEDMRRNLIDFGQHGIGPDLLLLLRTARAYPSIVHLSEPLVHFRDHAGSISRQRQTELARGYAWARARFVFSLARTTHT